MDSVTLATKLCDWTDWEAIANERNAKEIDDVQMGWNAITNRFIDWC